MQNANWNSICTRLVCFQLQLLLLLLMLWQPRKIEILMYRGDRGGSFPKSLPFASCGCCCCCCLFISACLTLKIIYKLFNTIYKLLPQTTCGLEGGRRRGTLLRHRLQSSHSFIANWFSFCAAHYECNCDDADVAAAFNCRPKMVKVIHVAAAERDGERVRASASEMAAKDAADWSVCNMLEQPQCCGNNATLF